MTELGSRKGAGRYRNRLWALAALAVAAQGCSSIDKLLRVEAPSQVEADDLNTPTAASLRVNSAAGDLACALTFYIVQAGMLGEEFMDTDGTTNNDMLDRRTMTGSNVTSLATPSCDAFTVVAPFY